MSTKEHSLTRLFERFIKDTKSGKRLQANGRKIKESSIKNYQFALFYLKEFEQHQGAEIRIRSFKAHLKNEWLREKKFWQMFYLNFTGFLYKRGNYDNFVGSQVKLLKVFLKYVETEYGIYLGSFYKQFYVLKEEVEILVLMPDQLKKLIYDRGFEQQLRLRMQLVKDIFVVGATVALRYGDLINIRWTDIVQRNGAYYLYCRSEKTDTVTTVKLPAYVMNIINKYHKKRGRRRIFPDICLDNFDTLIKQLFELAGWTEPIVKTRNVRGIPQLVKPENGRSNFRFCDMATSHMMRRTAITTMLMHGVQETVVKQISGHTKGSKSFYRYIAFVQPFMDMEIDKHFEKMAHTLPAEEEMYV